MNDTEQLFYTIKATHYEQVAYSLVLGGGILGMLTTEAFPKILGILFVIFGLLLEYTSWKIQNQRKKALTSKGLN